MNTVTLKLITIVTEAVLETKLLREILDLGATGYTLTKAHGQGSRGTRAGELEGNIKIETLVGPEVADLILAHVATHYFEHYAVVAYVTDTAVVRGEKYV